MPGISHLTIIRQLTNCWAMDEVVSIARALADPARVRALLALRGGELCACQVIELLGLAPSTVSKHMSILRQAGLVEARKEGRWMYYRLPAEEAPRTVREAIEWVVRALGDDERVRADVAQLCCITELEPSELWRKQTERSKCCSSAPETPAAVRWRKDGLATSKPTRSSRTPRGSKRTG